MTDDIVRENATVTKKDETRPNIFAKCWTQMLCENEDSGKFTQVILLLYCFMNVVAPIELRKEEKSLLWHF